MDTTSVHCTNENEIKSIRSKSLNKEKLIDITIGYSLNSKTAATTKHSFSPLYVTNQPPYLSSMILGLA